jgi:hypothetical protein
MNRATSAIAMRIHLSHGAGIVFAGLAQDQRQLADIGLQNNLPRLIRIKLQRFFQKQIPSLCSPAPFARGLFRQCVAGAGADQVRNRPQPEDRESARPDLAARAAGCRPAR